MKQKTNLPVKTEFYIFLAVVELSPEKARTYYVLSLGPKPDLHDEGTRCIIINKAVGHFGIPREQARALYDMYMASTARTEKELSVTARAGPKVEKRCNGCGSITTYVSGKGEKLWYLDHKSGSGYLCQKCYTLRKNHPEIQETRPEKPVQTKKAESCIACKSTVTYVYKGYPRWHTNPKGEGVLCHKCYSKINYKIQAEVIATKTN